MSITPETLDNRAIRGDALALDDPGAALAELKRRAVEAAELVVPAGLGCERCFRRGLASVSSYVLTGQVPRWDPDEHR